MVPRGGDSRPMQLPLLLPFEEALGHDDFLVGESNRAALALIERWPDWPAEVVLLAGPVGAGKSHLVSIWQEISGARRITARALSGADPVALVAGGALAIEDIDASPIDETALFHCLNAARAAGAKVLLTARQWPQSWGLKVADLVSRLRAATPVEVGEPDDRLLKTVLMKLFADRQMMVDAAVIDYLAVRMERSLSAAGVLVDALDREALATRKAVSRPMAATVLKRLWHREASAGGGRPEGTGDAD